MADRVFHKRGQIQSHTRLIESPLPDDVMPNIMLRVESRQDFSRLASTCHGFYAWSKPWLASRRQAAELRNDPKRLLKMPAWIEKHSRHLHPADWKAMLRWEFGTNLRESSREMYRKSAEVDVESLMTDKKYLKAFLKSAKANEKTEKAEMAIVNAEAKPMLPGFTPAGPVDLRRLPYLDFILFSPRMPADINPHVTGEARVRLERSGRFALPVYPSADDIWQSGGLASDGWQSDVLAGATCWLNENTENLDIDQRSTMFRILTNLIEDIMIKQRSPELVLQFLEHGLSKSHFVNIQEPQWQNPLLLALLRAALGCSNKSKMGKAVLPKSSPFVRAIHRIVATPAQSKRGQALLLLVAELPAFMELVPEKTWKPKKPGTECLHALVHAVLELPDALAEVKKTLLDRQFLTPGGWDELLRSMQRTSD